MTIKPVISQKSNEIKENHGHGQETQVTSVRTNHRNILVSKSSAEGQSPQRRTDGFDDVSRLLRSPHKSSNSMRAKRDHHHNKRGVEPQRDKHCTSPQYHQVHSATHGHTSTSCAVPSNSIKPTKQTAGSGGGSKDMVGLHDDRETYSGYNSGDEHFVRKENLLTPDEWHDRDEQFMKSMSDRGFIIQDIVEDGACLFRAISLQIFGDQEMHEVIRQQTMDYIYQNREYFGQFVTEDICSYVKRKRSKDAHGNHIEIQAMSEIYNRPVELYCYQTTPSNIFNSEQISNGYDPLRLSYQRGSHYNAIIDPYNASVGVGLGLADYKPESQTNEAIRLSEQQEIEQTMFEDKLKTTDWEATNEVIEEQIARESYLQWCRDNLHPGKTTTTTVTKSTSSTTSASNIAAAAVATTTTILSSTITSGSITENNFGNGSGVNGNHSKDLSQYHHYHGGDDLTTNSNVDMMKLLPSTTQRLRNGNDLSSSSSSSSASQSSTNCYDSDATDLSSTSSVDDLYKDNLQHLGLLKKLKYVGKRSTLSLGNCSNANKRRHKRRHRDTSDPINSDNSINDNVSTSPNKRIKQQQQQQQQQQTSNQQDDNQHDNNSDRDHLRNSKDVIAATYNYNSGLPGTSKQAAQIDELLPVSTFYQSLLESSYTEDGVRQLSESEMIVKAIRLSRIDFFENVKRQRRDNVVISTATSTTTTHLSSSRVHRDTENQISFKNPNNIHSNLSSINQVKQNEIQATGTDATVPKMFDNDDDSDVPSP